jgi:HlyD family secretion protein
VAAGEEGILERLVVSEGDAVKKGDPIGYLASYSLRQQEVRAAALKLERRTLSPLEIEAQASRVRLKEADAVHYRAEVVRQKGLVDSGLMPGKELDATELLAARAEEEVKVARADLKHLEGSVTLNLDDAQAELARAKILLERAVILSPIDGAVLKVLARPGEKVSGPIVQIGATGAMTALAEVHANDVHLVKLNQRASFTSAALPGPVEGKVTHIGAVVGRNRVFGEDPAAPDNARVFEVTVLLDDSSNAARFTNLEGQVRILLNSGR